MKKQMKKTNETKMAKAMRLSSDLREFAKRWREHGDSLLLHGATSLARKKELYESCYQQADRNEALANEIMDAAVIENSKGEGK